MRWAEGFIAIDWGTTNRRAWRIAGDTVDQEFADDKGVLSVAKADFTAAVAEIRERLGDHPLLMAGMIGSNRRWVEAPYVPCPAGLDEVAAAVKWAEPERTAIVPGLSSEPPDVMRGEEVQILGAVEAGLVPGDALVCHPGTHNKWALLEGGEVTCFRTVMTGEMFSSLSERGILADMLQGEVGDGEAFREGVGRGLERKPLTAELFSVRASVLLGRRPVDDAAAFTSGLLIGTDVAVGLTKLFHDEVYVMGRPDLTALYGAALEVAGRNSRQIDGEAAFLAGIKAIAGHL
jgi:2-dehydro-3-deoxygalactonokinase